MVILCLPNGESGNYTAMMFLNDEPPISAARKIWGLPKRWGEPKLEVHKTSGNLKFIPRFTGHLQVAELVAYNLTNITMHFHYSGTARLHLIPHFNASVADLPVLSVVEGLHFKANLTLHFDRIVHDYLALQGGGAHGAFTWGVLDRILEDGRLEIDAISGTSAGAMNAVTLANGYTEGGADGAREKLEYFWHSMPDAARNSPIKRALIDVMMGNWRLDQSWGYHAMGTSIRQS